MQLILFLFSIEYFIDLIFVNCNVTIYFEYFMANFANSQWTFWVAYMPDLTYLEEYQLF